jgi:hypothetical protein
MFQLYLPNLRASDVDLLPFSSLVGDDELFRDEAISLRKDFA